jgi:nucleotide-binding universal stress UspA family protein
MSEHVNEQDSEQGAGRGRIVVGVDGSESSKQALRWAARLSAAEGSHIEAITAWDYPQAYNSPVDPNWRPDLDAEMILDDTLREVFGDDRPAGLDPIVRHGPPRTVLIEASEGAELLIVGSRGHGGFAGLLLGSVSSACSEHAHCPVLVLHDKS